MVFTTSQNIKSKMKKLYTFFPFSLWNPVSTTCLPAASASNVTKPNPEWNTVFINSWQIWQLKNSQSRCKPAPHLQAKAIFPLQLSNASWNKKILKKLQKTHSKLFKTCVSHFLFFHQIIFLWKLWKMLFISPKKLFLFSRYSKFCNFFPSYPHFPDSKEWMKVE